MTHPKTDNYIDNTFAHGIWPLITKPTRLTSHSAILIDIIYTNKISSKVKSGIIISDVSDHFGILKYIKTKLKYNTLRCSNEANITILKKTYDISDRLQSSFKFFLVMYDAFITLYTDNFNQVFP